MLPLPFESSNDTGKMAAEGKTTSNVVEEREFVPGTVHLVDLEGADSSHLHTSSTADTLEGTMRAKHASKGQRDIVLVPTPSNDPDDPLNWSPRRKLLSTSCMCMYTLMASLNSPLSIPNCSFCFQVGIASAAIYSVLVPISEATGLTLGDLNAGTGYMYVFPHLLILVLH